MAVDFLPVCDLLFNFISVTTYFCDNAFAVIVAYSLYAATEDELAWFSVILFSLASSLLLCQVFSLKWFVEEEETEENAEKSRPAWGVAVGVHFFLSGVLWRYARLLFVPIDVARVKREMRNLSLLRMIHAFAQCLPCLLTQGYLVITRGSTLEHRPVYVTAASLSLLNICWALASFNKHVSRKNLHKLILTWMGVIAQLLWRLGTVGARCLALVLYASVYGAWLFLFWVLHWTCMLVWLLFQRKADKAEICSFGFAKRSLLLSHVYMVDFINLEEQEEEEESSTGTTRARMGMYYAIALVENTLLVSLWSVNIQTTLVYAPADRRAAFAWVFAPFFVGLTFMALYYRVFHVSRTSTEYSSRTSNQAATRKSSHKVGEVNKTVFNCALNPAIKKRKKIPRVIPPPPANAEVSSKPFWKQPLPLDSDQAAANSVDVDLIRQKLEEKRRKEMEQLRHLQAPPQHQHHHHHQHHDPPPPPPTDFIYMGEDPSPGYYATSFNHHDSSGDQGDIDSGEEIDWSSPHSSLNTYQPKLSYLPGMDPSAKRNGARAETQL